VPVVTVAAEVMDVLTLDALDDLVVEEDVLFRKAAAGVGGWFANEEDEVRYCSKK
jgi:hypothetical protein